MKNHDVIMKWKRFLYYWPFVMGIHWSLMDYLHKETVMQTFDVSSMLARKQPFEQIFEWPVMWNAMMLMWHHFNSSPPSAAYMNQVSIDSDNVLSPIRRQAITWTNTGLLSTGPLGTNFSETLINIQNFSFTKMHQKISSAKWQPFFSDEWMWCLLISSWRSWCV